MNTLLTTLKSKQGRDNKGTTGTKERQQNKNRTKRGENTNTAKNQQSW